MRKVRKYIYKTVQIRAFSRRCTMQTMRGDERRLNNYILCYQVYNLNETVLAVQQPQEWGERST